MGGFLVTAELWSASRGPEKISVDLTPDDTLALVALTNPDSPPFVAPPSSVVREQWMCVELEVAVDDAAGSLVLSVDGTELLNETGLDTSPDAPIDSVVIASTIEAGSGGVQYYVDEFVVARAPIGCDVL